MSCHPLQSEQKSKTLGIPPSMGSLLVGCIVTCEKQDGQMLLCAIVCRIKHKWKIHTWGWSDTLNDATPGSYPRLVNNREACCFHMMCLISSPWNKNCKSSAIQETLIVSSCEEWVARTFETSRWGKGWEHGCCWDVKACFCSQIWFWYVFVNCIWKQFYDWLMCKHSTLALQYIEASCLRGTLA